MSKSYVKLIKIRGKLNGEDVELPIESGIQSNDDPDICEIEIPAQNVISIIEVSFEPHEILTVSIYVNGMFAFRFAIFAPRGSSYLTELKHFLCKISNELKVKHRHSQGYYRVYCIDEF